MGLPQKDPSQRINRVKPVSEWVDLEPLQEPVLPAYPPAWYKREARAWTAPKWMWDLWRVDAVTGAWSPADIAQALDLGSSWNRYKPEHRLRMLTTLGLNAAGRRNLRLRNPVESKNAERADANAVEARRLRIVREDDEKAG
jgi:hypothetical protein